MNPPPISWTWLIKTVTVMLYILKAIRLLSICKTLFVKRSPPFQGTSNFDRDLEKPKLIKNGWFILLIKRWKNDGQLC